MLLFVVARQASRKEYEYGKACKMCLCFESPITQKPLMYMENKKMQNKVLPVDFNNIFTEEINFLSVLAFVSTNLSQMERKADYTHKAAKQQNYSTAWCQ